MEWMLRKLKVVMILMSGSTSTKFFAQAAQVRPNQMRIVLKAAVRQMT